MKAEDQVSSENHHCLRGTSPFELLPQAAAIDSTRLAPGEVCTSYHHYNENETIRSTEIENRRVPGY